LSDPVLTVERVGAVAQVRLNRPAVGNAFNVELARALMEAAIACDEDDSVRCVVITGAGRMFCAGGDVSGFASAGDKAPALIKEITAYLHAAIAKFARMPKPVITAINGPAAGAGFSLALVGDFALAASSATLSLAYPAIGLSPDGGASFFLPRLIGLRRAQELMLLNPRLTATEASEMGLITRAVEDSSLESEVWSLAEKLAQSATGALGRARQLLLQSYGATLESQMEAESRAIADSARSVHGKAGIQAFLAKRKPEFL
jgi:2-(1,2-epoxy-1,2-dihydrophenyl)acetyl-CoA isomerase